MHNIKKEDTQVLYKYLLIYPKVFLNLYIICLKHIFTKMRNPFYKCIYHFSMFPAPLSVLVLFYLWSKDFYPEE